MKTTTNPCQTSRHVGQPPLKRHILLLLALTALFYLPVLAQNTQVEPWVAGDKLLEFDATPNNQMPPNIAKTFSNSALGPVAIANDNKGGVYFYVRDYKVYDGNDAQIATLPVPPQFSPTSGITGYWNASTQVTIVPFVETPNCTKRYYLFYVSFDPNVAIRLHAKIVTVTLPQNTVTITDYAVNGIPVTIASRPYYTFTNNGFLVATAGIACSKVLSGNRYLYFVTAQDIQKVVLSSNTGVNFGISSATTLTYDKTTFFDKIICEAEVSDDGTKLMWGGTDYVLGVYDNNLSRIPFATIHAINIDENGEYTSTMKTLSYRYSVRGFQYNKDFTKLFFTSGYTTNNTDDGIYMVDLTNPFNITLTQILATKGFANSQLQMSENGLIYALSGNQLLGLNPQTGAKEHNLFLSSIVPSTQHYQFLPSKIYGDWNNPFHNPFFDNPILNDEYQPIVINTSTTWNASTFNKTALKITKGITVTGVGTVFRIDNLSLEFTEEAKIRVEGGAKLELANNCTLRGMACLNTMWQGIELKDYRVNNNPVGVSFINTQSNNGFTTIRDAYTAINMESDFTFVNDALGNVKFIANETGIHFNGGGVIDYFTKAIFDNDVPLVNQSRGSNNGYTDGLKRGIYAMYGTNPTIKLPATQWSASYKITGGQYGYYINKRNVLASYPFILRGPNLQCTNPKMASIQLLLAPTTGDQVKELYIEQVQFKNCANAVILDYLPQLYPPGTLVASINRCVFDNITNYGININRGNGRKIYIGRNPANENDPTYRNQFVNSGTAAIYLFSNESWDRIDDGTEIYITHNTITGRTNGSTGIWLAEPSGGVRKYKSLKINRNIINNVSWGIITTNAVGGNPNDPKYDKYVLGQYPLNEMSDNTITVRNNGYWLGGTVGIKPTSSGGVNHLRNQISPATNTGSRSIRSLQLSVCPNSLVYDNRTSTGYGLSATGSMVNSNYYCNQFSQAQEGITLTSHMLRITNPTTHGVVGSESRSNYFINRPAGAKDIHLVQSFNNHNLWVFHGAPPQIVYTSPINYSSTLPPAANIVAGYGPDICGLNNLPADPGNGNGVGAAPGASGVEKFSLKYYDQVQHRMGYQQNPITNTNIINLVDAEALMAYPETQAQALNLINSIDASTECANQQELMADYKLLYQTYLNYLINATTPRSMGDEAVAILTTIAQKNGITQSPAAFTARAILWDERQLRIEVEAFEPELVLAGNISADCGFTNLAANAVYLQRNTNQLMAEVAYTDENGAFAFNPDVVNTYNDGYQYRYVLTAPDGTNLYSPYAPIRELALLSDYEFTCALGKKGAAKQLPTKPSNQTTNNSILIYPNPNNGSFTLTGVENTAAVSVSDLTGKLLIQQVSISSNGTVELGNLSSGLYLLNIKQHGTTTVQKISIR